MRFIQDIWVTLKSLYYNPTVTSLPDHILKEFDRMSHNIVIEEEKASAASGFNETIYHCNRTLNMRDEFRCLLNCVEKSFPACKQDLSKIVDRLSEINRRTGRKWIADLLINSEFLFRKNGIHDKCPICFNESELVTLQCNHSFHKNCITRWFKTGKLTCPCCRADC